MSDGNGDHTQPPIAGYAFLSDCQSAALVDRDGSVDWWCAPRFDSPSVFGRLLDPSAGHWSLRPCAAYTSERCYVDGTLVLRTVFETAAGAVALTDAAALQPGARGHELGIRSPHALLRRVEGLRGAVELETELAPRMEYGKVRPHLRSGDGTLTARGGSARLTLTTPVPLQIVDDVVAFPGHAGRAVGRFVVEAGDVIELVLRHEPSFPADVGGVDDPPGAAPTIADTVAAWRSWSQLHDRYHGRFTEEVRRSTIVLQGLTYQPSGAIVAAATTSLPEAIGGDDNYDYRYAWLRDLSLTVRSLWIAACPDEPGRLFDWFTNATGRLDGGSVQIIYGVGGERDLSERTLDHLAGYHGSRPVRAGNAAWSQVQLDVLGEVLDAAATLEEQLGDLDPDVAHLLVALADHAAGHWHEPDAGMWEARDRDRQYVSSKVMCWVALDRAVGFGERLGDADARRRWAAAADEVRTAVLEQAWSETAGAYAGAFGSDDLDASVLLLPLVGFLPATDERMHATIEAIASRLTDGTLIRRWPSDPRGFLICTFWLVECLALGGQHERAGQVFGAAIACANDLGLMSEQVDGRSGLLLGNFPQAFSHVGLINAAWRLDQAPATSHPRHRQETE